MSTPTWAWLIWGLAFVALEGFGLFDNRPGGTLSELVWATFKVRDRRPTRTTWFLRGVLALFMGWLTYHFLTGRANLDLGWLGL